MGNLINKALTSVLDQLTEDFEMIVVDDGSTDSSLRELEKLKLKYPNLRTLYLPKDKKRTLAETRNISVREAKGKYCLLHIDCDDFWEPYLLDFVKVFHLIENTIKSDFLLKGHQVNMGRKEFLVKHGPYKHGHMVEDRDLWHRMARIQALVPLEHVVFRKRLDLNKKQKLKKKYFLIARIVRDEIRSGYRFQYYFRNVFLDYATHPLKLRVYKLIVYPLVYMSARKLGFLQSLNFDADWETLAPNKIKNAKTVIQILNESSELFPAKLLSARGYWIFSNSSKDKQLSDMPDFKN